MKGRTAVASTLARIQAPSTAPSAPATPSRSTNRQSTLRCQMCEAAEPAVVKISAVCTIALACAGGIPIDSMAVVEIIPNAIPSAPSTSCAANPIRPSRIKSVSTGRPPLLRALRRSAAECVHRTIFRPSTSTRLTSAPASVHNASIHRRMTELHAERLPQAQRRSENAHSRRPREKGSLALELDHPSRQSYSRKQRRPEGRRASGLLRLARRDHDGALLPRAAPAGPRGGKAACLAELPRDPVSAGQADARKA